MQLRKVKAAWDDIARRQMYITGGVSVAEHGFFRRPDCCTVSGGRIISMMPSFIYAAVDHAVFINQFVQSSAQINGTLQNSVRITQNTK